MNLIIAFLVAFSVNVFANNNKPKVFELKISNSLSHEELKTHLDHALSQFSQAFSITAENSRLWRNQSNELVYTPSIDMKNYQSLKKAVLLTHKNAIITKETADLIYILVNGLMKKMLPQDQLLYRPHILHLNNSYSVALAPSLDFETAPNFDGSKTITFTSKTAISLELCEHIKSSAEGIAIGFGTTLFNDFSCGGNNISFSMATPIDKNLQHVPALAVLESGHEDFHEHIFFIQDFVFITLQEFMLNPSKYYFFGYYSPTLWESITSCFGCTEEPTNSRYVLQLFPIP